MKHMDAFYELDRDSIDELLVEDGVMRDYPLHFHSQIELFLFVRGGFEITINGDRRELAPYTVTMADSFDLHSSTNHASFAENCLVIIPFRYLTDYMALKKEREIGAHFITDEGLCRELLSLAHGLARAKSELLVKAYVDHILGLISERVGFVTSNKMRDLELIQKILLYIEQHFKEDITLAVIAHDLGYSREHISRIFRNYFSCTLPAYVNELRLKYVSRLMAENPEYKVSFAAFEAGFNSMQTYYRVRGRNDK